jgi:hypothetical protein
MEVDTPSPPEALRPTHPLAHPAPTLPEISSCRVRGASLWGLGFALSAFAAPERAATLAILEGQIKQPRDALPSHPGDSGRAAGAPSSLSSSSSSAAALLSSARRPLPLARLRMLQALHAIVVEAAHNLSARPEDVCTLEPTNSNDQQSNRRQHAPGSVSQRPLPPSGAGSGASLGEALPLTERCCRAVLRVQARFLISLIIDKDCSPLDPQAAQGPSYVPVPTSSPAARRANAAADFLYAVLVGSGHARDIAAADLAARAAGSGGGENEPAVGGSRQPPGSGGGESGAAEGGSRQHAEFGAGGGGVNGGTGGHDGSGGGGIGEHMDDTPTADATAVVRCYKRTGCSLGATAIAAAAASARAAATESAPCAPQRDVCVLCSSPVQVSACFLQGHRCGNGHVRSRCWLCFETVRLTAWKCSACGGRACCEHDSQPAAMLGPLRAVSPPGVCGLCGSRCQLVSLGPRGVVPMS